MNYTKPLMRKLLLRAKRINTSLKNKQDADNVFNAKPRLVLVKVG